MLYKNRCLYINFKFFFQFFCSELCSNIKFIFLFFFCNENYRCFTWNKKSTHLSGYHLVFLKCSGISKLVGSKISNISLVLPEIDVSTRKTRITFCFGVFIATFSFKILSMTLLILPNVICESALLLFESIALIALIIHLSDISLISVMIFTQWFYAYFL